VAWWPSAAYSEPMNLDPDDLEYAQLCALVAEELKLGSSLLDARNRIALAFECAYVRRMLAQAAGNISNASARAGVSRKAFKTSMDRCNLRG
jgi:DNA-binding NtrC family response regulator